MEITLTQATPADLPAVGGLYAAVCDGLADKPYNPGWRRGMFPTEENARLYQQTGVLLLAHAGGRLAGSLGLTDNPSAEAEDAEEAAPAEAAENHAPPPAAAETGAGQPSESAQATATAPGPVWYVHVVAVHPAFARQGVAGRLLAQAETLARQAGVAALRLFVWENNTPAIAAYEKNGFTPLQTGVDIGLAPYGLERFTLYQKLLP